MIDDLSNETAVHTELEALRRRISALTAEVDEIRRERDELQASEAQLRVLIDATSSIGWTTGPDGSNEKASDSLLAFAGVTQKEMHEQGWTIVLHPDDRAQSYAAWQQAMAKRDIMRIEYRLKRHDGVYRDFLAVSAPQLNKDGEITGWLGIGVDITARKQVERALHVSEERFRLLVTHLPVAVFQTDAEGMATFLNERWCKIAGLKEEEALGPGWMKALHPEDRERVGEAWYETTKKGRFFHMECRFQKPSEETQWIAASAVPLRDETGRVVAYFGTLIDINDRKHAEELLRESLTQKAIIEAQGARLAELSTPLIPLSDDIMVMPLVGELDAARMAQVLESLLGGISQNRARFAILDITGVVNVDTAVANGLISAAKAVRLLGAQMMLTGIRPEVAQTLVGLGAELSGIVTSGNLQAGIAYALTSTQKGG